MISSSDNLIGSKNRFGNIPSNITEIAKGIKQALHSLSSKEKKLIVVMGSLYWVGSVLKEN